MTRVAWLVFHPSKSSNADDLKATDPITGDLDPLCPLTSLKVRMPQLSLVVRRCSSITISRFEAA